MSDFFSTPDDLGEIRQSDLHASLGESLAAQAADALDPKNSLSGMYLFRRAREENAGGGNIGVPGAGGELDVFSGQPLEERQVASEAFRAAVPDTAIADARARVKQEGLEGHLKLPDQPSIKSPVLDLMINEAHDRRDRELAIARGPQGFIPGALGLVTSLGAGMIDPVNMAAFSIPVLGEARMGRLMASAGDSILSRTGVRALQGAAQGAAGTAVLQPADWWLHTQDGQDYTFADALKSVVMGAGMGAGFHAGFGAIGDVRARMRGIPLPGSPEDLLTRGLMTGRQSPELGEPVPSSRVDQFRDGQSLLNAPAHPADVLADLPPAAREDAFRATVADIAADRPTRAAEMLQIAADHDPRIAESLEPFHNPLKLVEAPEGGVYRPEQLKPSETTFTTAKGSTYVVHEDGTTTRNKASRADVGHEGDSGLKPRTEKTIYVASEVASELSGAGLSGLGPKGFRVAIKDGRAYGLTWNEKAERWGASPGARDIPFTTAPEVGKSPVELWKPTDDVPGHEAYRGQHAGNPITEVRTKPEEISGLSETLAPIEKDANQPPAPQRETTITINGQTHRIQYSSHGEGSGPGDQPGLKPAADLQQPLSRYYGGEAGPGRSIGGVGDRGNPASHGERAARAAEDPRWRELADARPAEDAPEVIAESRAADRLPEPDSLVPEKSLNALEKEAADAEAIWRKLEPTLSEKERQLVNDVLDQLKLDKEARDQIITDGAACLVGAVA